LVGAALCGGYVLLGATWLILRTEGALQRKAMGWTRWGLAWVALGVALVSLATPTVSELVYARWFDFPETLALMGLPAATLVSWLWVWRSGGRSGWKPLDGAGAGWVGRADWSRSAGPVAIFVLACIGLAYSVFPYSVLGWLTIWEAAAHPSALKVTLGGALIGLRF